MANGLALDLQGRLVRYLQRLAVDQVGQSGEQSGKHQEDQVRHARQQTQHAQRAAGHQQGVFVGGQLFGQLLGKIILGGHPGHQNTCSGRDDQGRHLGHQAIANGQSAINAQCFAKAQVMHHHANDQAAHQVDDQNHDARDRIAAHELGGAIHRAEKVCLLAHIGPSLFRFFLFDQARVQVGIDRHLLAWHGVERKAG